MASTDFRGIFPAFPTPLGHDGQLDKAALHQLVEFQIEQGAGGLVPLGGTGEFTSLGAGIRQAVIAETVAATKGRVPVVAGVLSPGLGDAVESASAFMKAGADALMVIPPYYARTGQEGVIRYFEAFQNAVRAPVLLYDNPARSRLVLEPETIAHLAERGLIFGMKASSTDLYHFDHVMQRVSDRFAMLSGQDTLFTQQVAMGARGGVLTSAVLTPGFWNNVQTLVEQGDFMAALDRQRQLCPLMDALFAEENPAPIRAALGLIGIEVGVSVAPLAEVSAALLSRLKTILGDAVAKGLVNRAAALAR